MNRLDLYFTSTPELQLVKSCFYLHYNAPIIAVRGKSFPHLGHAGSFLWSSGVKALVYLLIQTVCLYQIDPKSHYVLTGPKKSLAHSLTLTLMKEPNWLAEMFGTDVNGKSYAKNLINLRNQYYNFGDQVEVSINPNCIDLGEINFYLNNQKLSSLKNLIQLRESLHLVLYNFQCQRAIQPSEVQLFFDFI